MPTFHTATLLVALVMGAVPCADRVAAGGWALSGVVVGVGDMIRWLGRFHPPATHFPIAMILGAALAELLFAVTGRRLFTDSSRYCLWIGAFGAVFAATLGWFLGGFSLVDSDWVKLTHRWLGTFTALWAVLLLLVNERVHRAGHSARRRRFRVLLAVGAVAVGAAGFFGGALVYGLDHYAW